jgi:two-component system cell cycle response regulator DivK
MDRRRPPRPPPARPLVLIVDAHDDTRELYVFSLSAMGFDAMGVANGAEACERAWQTHPDIIMTELAMPNCDGNHLTHKLKQNPRTRDIPVVALTGYVQNDGADLNGFAAFFRKPCLPDELAAGLHQVLDERALAPPCFDGRACANALESQDRSRDSDRRRRQEARVSAPHRASDPISIHPLPS